MKIISVTCTRCGKDVTLHEKCACILRDESQEVISGRARFEKDVCVWKAVSIESDGTDFNVCGNRGIFKSKYADWKFCPFCGRPIKEVTE